MSLDLAVEQTSIDEQLPFTIDTRIDEEEALKLLEKADLLALGKAASAVKARLHPDKITTFVVDRNINYTNICWVDCKFCAFYRHAKDEDAYILSFDEISKKIDELLDIGGTQILFQGGVHPKLKIDYYEELVSFIHKKYPQIDIHGFSAVEVDYISRISRIPIKEVLQRLNDCGLFSIPGAGAEILNERVRKMVSPKKVSTQKWLDIHQAAHEIGMKTTATMMFGMGETKAEIIEHLSRIRKLQDKTGGFRAFIAWSFQSSNTQLIKEYPNLKKTSSNQYLRLLAVSRIFLDNFPNIQSSWVTQGSYIGQMALKFGANDLGSTMMEENVVSAAGAYNKMNQDQMIELIKDLGEYPAKRNTAYEILQAY